MALGERVRQRRARLGWSSRTLGEAVGVSLQQIRRYERGADRMSAAMLIRLCGALGVTIAEVCDGLGWDGAESTAMPPVGRVDRLVADFVAIRDSAVRSQLARLVASMAASS